MFTMKTPFATSLFVVLSLAHPLRAQNFIESIEALPKGSGDVVPMLSDGEPVLDLKAQSNSSEDPAVFASQDARTLEPALPRRRDTESVVDLRVLQKPSLYHMIAVGRHTNAAGIPAESVKQDLALISATYREVGEVEADCQTISLSVEQRIKLDSSKVLEIVETEIQANPACACEVIKSAITACDADSDLVVSMVEVTISTAPEMMRIASQCAIAAVPESLAAVQTLLARYDANAGDGYSSKSAKSTKSAKGFESAVPSTVAAISNPLDFPGNGPVGPIQGGPGGYPLIPVLPPVMITPPVVTAVDP